MIRCANHKRAGGFRCVRILLQPFTFCFDQVVHQVLVRFLVNHHFLLLGELLLLRLLLLYSTFDIVLLECLAHPTRSFSQYIEILRHDWLKFAHVVVVLQLLLLMVMRARHG